MILVVYMRDSGNLVGWTPYDDSVKITSDSIVSDGLKLKGVDFNLVAYGYYKDIEVPPPDEYEPVQNIKDLFLEKASTGEFEEATRDLKAEIDELKAKVNDLERRA